MLFDARIRRGIRPDLATIGSRITTLEVMLAEPPERLGHRVPGISAWSVAQHLDHVALVLESNVGVIRAIEADEHSRFSDQPRPGAIARLVLLVGRIPRGRARAPERVLPADLPDIAETRARLARVRAAHASLGRSADALASREGRIVHPTLGAFTAAQWVRFARVHVDHHLKIVRDIRRAVDR